MQLFYVSEYTEDGDTIGDKASPLVFVELISLNVPPDQSGLSNTEPVSAIFRVTSMAPLRDLNISEIVVNPPLTSLPLPKVTRF